MGDISPETIIEVATGYTAAKQLFVAVEIGLFEQLAGGPAPLDQLARHTSELCESSRIRWLL